MYTICDTITIQTYLYQMSHMNPFTKYITLAFLAPPLLQSQKHSTIAQLGFPVISASEIQLLTLSECCFQRTIWALERPCITLRKLLDGLFAQHMAAWHQHWGILSSALLPRHWTCKYGMKVKCILQLNLNWHLFKSCPLLHPVTKPYHHMFEKVQPQISHSILESTYNCNLPEAIHATTKSLAKLSM